MSWRRRPPPHMRLGWCARRTGLRSAGSRTAVPISTRCTRLATAASNVNGSWRGRARSESPAQTESKPRRSARSANSSSGAACGCPAITRSRVGSKYPMRMDMAFSAPIVNAVCLEERSRLLNADSQLWPRSLRPDNRDRGFIFAAVRLSAYGTKRTRRDGLLFVRFRGHSGHASIAGGVSGRPKRPKLLCRNRRAVQICADTRP